MKKTLFAVLLASACALTAKSQTKGTNAIGLGVRSVTNEYEFGSGTSKIKESAYYLSYGRFIQDNARLSLTASYSSGKSDPVNFYTSKSNGYGGSIDYQRYHPLFTKFYIVAGGQGGFSISEAKTKQEGQAYVTTSSTNNYNIGAYGGLAYFVSKRFAFEARLLSANAAYSKEKGKLDAYSNTITSFNLSTTGSINNLGFNIYFLF